MKVFIYDKPNELNSLFGEPDYNIPFLSTSLLNFATMGIVRNAHQLVVGSTIYLPDSWEIKNTSFYSSYTNIVDTLKEHQSKEYELVFLMSLYSVMVGDFSGEDLAHLKQNPGKMFQNNGVIGGYLRTDDGLPEPEEFNGFDAFWKVTIENYLEISQHLVGQLTLKSKELDPSVTVYGNPSILSSQIRNSTICAPTYISEEASIVNSYIAPGTIISGRTTISGSRVFGSFISDSTLVNMTLTDSIVTGAHIESLKMKSSFIPIGSILHDER